MLLVQQNINLTSFNTLHLYSIAKNYTILDNLANLVYLRELIAKFDDYLILGGGSNIILPNTFTGLIVHNQLKGISIDKDNDYYYITAMSGENWDEFVQYTINNGIVGLENLSLIPGTVGASPVQNIGAYGVEVKDYIDYVTVFDLATNQIIRLTNAECEFSYRNSIFKHKANYVVISVTFKISLNNQLNCNYGDILQKLANFSTPNAQILRDIIVDTRKSKLPDPNVIGNVGSFFHNPIISSNNAKKLLLKYPNIPHYSTDNPDKIKISAGWLIDNLGYKGFSRGNFAVYDKQALVLIHKGGGDKQELLDFAGFIQTEVFAYYGIKLTIEPIII